MTREDFQDLIATVTTAIAGRPLDDNLMATLNDRFPAGGDTFRGIADACHAAIAEGWMCKHEGGGIRYGRVLKPAPEIAGFSVDVVRMADIAGPHHRHPNGEIDMIMPLDDGAKFDGHGAGWFVYGPDSAHSPTVTGGAALVLYLLPDGAIEFTGA
jgi:hypothetical protein